MTPPPIQHVYQHLIFGYFTKLAERRRSDWKVGFLFILDDAGNIEREYFGDEAEFPDAEKRQELRDTAVSFIEYDPYDAPREGIAAWKNIPRELMAKLCGDEVTGCMQPPYVESDSFLFQHGASPYG